MLSTTSDNNNMQNTLNTATGLSYGSGFAGFVAGLSLHEWLAIMGAVFMVLTYFTNLYFRRRDEIRKQADERRRQAEHEKRMAAL